MCNDDIIIAGIDSQAIDAARAHLQSYFKLKDLGQCNESHIEEVILKEKPYKNLGSPTPISSFWDVVLPRTYTRYK